CQACAEQLIHQNAEMLWVILEFDDVVVSVRAPHQVRLRAPRIRRMCSMARNIRVYPSGTSSFYQERGAALPGDSHCGARTGPIRRERGRAPIPGSSKVVPMWRAT